MQFSLCRVEGMPFVSRLPVPVQAMLAQGIAILLCGAIVWCAQMWGYFPNLGNALLLQSLIVVTISLALRMPSWWLLIQALFLPAVVLALTWRIAPQWYLLAFLLMLSMFWSTFFTKVPLYLSRRHVWNAVAQQLSLKPNLHVADLGSGLGGLVHDLARQRDDCRIVGIESAPLPSAISRLRTAWQGNSQIIWGDFWQRDLGEFDVVFAYLSPVPMPALWEKAKREMRPGSLLISYRFPVPDVEPTRVVSLQDVGQTKLYIWQL